MHKLPRTSSQRLPAQNTGGLYETCRLIRVLLLKRTGQMLDSSV